MVDSSAGDGGQVRSSVIANEEVLGSIEGSGRKNRCRAGAGAGDDGQGRNSVIGSGGGL